MFFIKYLRTLGFEATNDIFAENAWYFRNALVRANYSNIQKGIHETTEYVEVFLRNLLLNENNELHNREMHISGKYTFSKNKAVLTEKVNIQDEKVNIQDEKVNIYIEQENIGQKIYKIINDNTKLDTVSSISKNQITKLYIELAERDCFGRGDVEQVLEVKTVRAHKIIKLMKDLDIIIPVKGKGKGKYRFKLKDE